MHQAIIPGMAPTSPRSAASRKSLPVATVPEDDALVISDNPVVPPAPTDVVHPKVPRALLRLMPHNEPGIKEDDSVPRPRRRQLEGP